jgi:hypothetical protein
MRGAANDIASCAFIGFSRVPPWEGQFCNAAVTVVIPATQQERTMTEKRAKARVSAALFCSRVGREMSHVLIVPKDEVIGR